MYTQTLTGTKYTKKERVDIQQDTHIIWSLGDTFVIRENEKLVTTVAFIQVGPSKVHPSPLTFKMEDVFKVYSRIKQDKVTRLPRTLGRSTL